MCSSISTSSAYREENEHRALQEKMNALVQSREKVLSFTVTWTSLPLYVDGQIKTTHFRISSLPDHIRCGLLRKITRVFSPPVCHLFGWPVVDGYMPSSWEKNRPPIPSIKRSERKYKKCHSFLIAKLLGILVARGVPKLFDEILQ